MGFALFLNFHCFFIDLFERPLTHSEHLAQLISKIDFYADSAEDEETSAAETAVNKDEVTNARKFYQSLHETVK